jgi:hypothetical protein
MCISGVHNDDRINACAGRSATISCPEVGYRTALEHHYKEVVDRESSKPDAYSPDNDDLRSFYAYLPEKDSNINLYEASR